MSFHGGAALSLFGRPQDELSHVLVHPDDFERCRDFWYPTRHEHWMESFPSPQHSLKSVNAQQAIIELATIPFVRVRDQLPTALLDRPMDYAEWVSRANAAITGARPMLKLCTENRLVSATGFPPFRLDNAQFALYQLMAEWLQQAGGTGTLSEPMLRDPVNRPCGSDNPVSMFIRIYRDTFKFSAKENFEETGRITDRPTNDAQRKDNGKYFRELKSKLMKSLRRQFGNGISVERYGGWKDPSRGYGTVRHFGIKLLPGDVDICSDTVCSSCDLAVGRVTAVRTRIGADVRQQPSPRRGNRRS